MAKNDKIMRLINIECHEDSVLPYEIHVSVTGMYHSHITSIRCRKMLLNSMEDKTNGRILHSLGIRTASYDWLIFGADMVISPDGIFHITKVDETPTSIVRTYETKEYAEKVA